MTFFINADKSEDTMIFHSDRWLIRKAPKKDLKDPCLYEIVIMDLAPAIAKVSFTGFKKIMNTLRSKKVRNIYITSDENITFDYE